MTPQEREMIDGLFQRLTAADTPQKDHEAEDLIAKRTVALPSAPYLLVQTVLVQDHALGAAQQRIAQLEKELADAHKAQAQAPAAAAGGTSFLGGLLGGRWNQGGAAPAAATAPHSSVPITAPSGSAQAAPSYAAPGPAPYAAAAPAGGGFLHSALTTAAGVAAGGLLYDGLSSLLFHRPGPFSPYVGAGFGGFGGGFGGSPWGSAGGGNVYETINNYGTAGNQPDPNAIDTSGNDPGYDPSANDPGAQDVSYDPSESGTVDDGSSNFDDGSSGDFGGGNDDMSV
jgi:hypothetical protein